MYVITKDGGGGGQILSDLAEILWMFLGHVGDQLMKWASRSENKFVFGTFLGIRQLMPKVIILGCIYAHPSYRDLMRAEGPKHIPMSRMGINIA